VLLEATMAINNTQRKIALNEILINFGNPQRLAQILPGVNQDAILNALLSSFGSNFDVQLDQVLEVKSQEASTRVTDAESAVQTAQNDLALWTVV
jgi:hypothetical protein